MPGKSGQAKGSAGSKLVGGLAGAGAAFAARKLLETGWKKVTGNEPPDHPEDPQVGMRDALIWAVLVGATVSIARMLAAWVTARPHGDAAAPEDRRVV